MRQEWVHSGGVFEDWNRYSMKDTRIDAIEDHSAPSDNK